MLHITIMIIVSLCTINVLGGPEKGRVVMPTKWSIIYLEEVYFVTALVPSETACLASSPGRRSLTAVWISRDEMVDFLLYLARVEASRATRSKISLTREFIMFMAFEEIPVSG